MIKWSLKYRIENFGNFFDKFVPYVDTINNYKESFWIPSKMKYDYFGKIEYGNFTIYQLEKRLFKKSIVSKIVGKMNQDILEITFKGYSIIIQILNFLVLTIFSIMLMFDWSFYIGLFILIINVLQMLFYMKMLVKKKKEFQSLMDSIISK